MAETVPGNENRFQLRGLAVQPGGRLGQLLAMRTIAMPKISARVKTRISRAFAGTTGHDRYDSQSTSTNATANGINAIAAGSTRPSTTSTTGARPTTNRGQPFMITRAGPVVRSTHTRIGLAERAAGLP